MTNDSTTGCPLCGQNDHDVLEVLPFAAIKKIYRRQFRIIIDDNLDEVALHVCGNCGLKFYIPALTGDERFYEGLQGYDWYYMADKEEYKTAAGFVPPGSDVLEIGAGRGLFRRHMNCGSYTGLEFSAHAIEMAKKDGISICNQSIGEHADSNRGRYDVVCAFQVLEHVADAREFMSSAARCLKTGGRLIISVPNESGFVGRETNNVLNMPPHHVTRWTDACLVKMAGLFNLKLVALEYETLSDTHLRPYGICMTQDMIRNVFKRKRSQIDSLFSFFPVRLLVRILAIIPMSGLRETGMRPYGHSVTAVYEKLP